MMVPIGTVLVVHQDTTSGRELADALRTEGFRAIHEGRPRDALDLAVSEEIECLITALHMSGVDGISLCRSVSEARPELPVVVVADEASLESSIGALRAGAFDFLVRPADDARLGWTVDRAIRQYRLASEVHSLRSAADRSASSGRLVGDSRPMRDLRALIERLAETRATVLLSGESGTGKELVARELHDRSGAADAPFVAINCAAVPANLLESELFGHAKGAFTDARADRRGLLAQAEHGTLFLDEIGDMPLDMQAKLLRVLQERRVRPLGSNVEVPFDARVVSATNIHIEDAVARGEFREDLYYRLNVCSLEVPPLRDRSGDIPLLARVFVRRFGARHDKAVRGIDARALSKLVRYPWPGNVRELENGIERAVAMTRHDRILVEDLPERVRGYRRQPMGVPLPGTEEETMPLAQLERAYVEHVLAMARGNRSHASRLLGIDRRTLHRKLERWRDGDAAEERKTPRAALEGSSPAEGDRGTPPPVGRSGESPSAREHASGRTILVVDDDGDDLRTLQVLLEAVGYEVITANGVAEAMRTRRVDAVVTEVHLGDGEGADLVGRFGDAPVVAIGALRFREGAPKGFRQWMEKPLTLHTVASTIEAVFAEG